MVVEGGEDDGVERDEEDLGEVFLEQRVIQEAIARERCNVGGM